MTKGLHRFFALSLLLMLVPAPVFALSLEAAVGPAYSRYTLSEGSTEYSENTTWRVTTVQGSLPLAGTLRAVGTYQFGDTTYVEIVKGAPAWDQSGRVSRYLAGVEAVWQPASLFNFGIGAGYLSEMQEHTWKAAHPNVADSEVFTDPAEELDWSWKRTTSGLALMASVNMDAGRLRVAGRIGYAPSVRWDESTQAAKGDVWERWEPETAKATAAVYELKGRFGLLPVLSLVGGVEGIVQQSPKLDEMEEKFSNSTGYSTTRTATNVSKAFDHRISAYLGVSFSF